MSMRNSRLMRLVNSSLYKLDRSILRLSSLYWRPLYGREKRTFVTSIPKSGTHLVERCLRLMPGMYHSGRLLTARKGRHRDVQDTEPVLNRLGTGCFVMAHLPFSEERRAILDRLNYRLVLMIRDPRDLVVSQYIFLGRSLNVRAGKLRTHFRSIPSEHERLTTTITGIPDTTTICGLPDLLPSIKERFDSYLLWRDAGAYETRYENLVGAKGGGTQEKQTEEIKGLATHLDIKLSGEQALRIGSELWSQHAGTFRKGMIGDWPNHFTKEHKKIFKEVTGDLLIRLGYESNMDW